MVAPLRRNMARSLRERNLDEAATVLERLKREDPLAVQTRGFELEFLLGSKRLDEARRLAEQLVVLFPGSARIFYLAGQVDYRRKQYPTAASHFRESLRIHVSWLTRSWLGRTLTQMGRFAEAEPILSELVVDHPHVNRDLGWLYERMGDQQRAVKALEKYLAAYPDDRFVTAQIDRLQAQMLGPEQLMEEIDGLLELGEEIPGDLLPEYVDSLLRTGHGQRAREVLASIEAGLEPRVATRVAWVCHRLQAYDLAYRLLLRSLADKLADIKHLNALESDALRCGRADELEEHYEALAGEQPRLWGRIRSLKKRAAKSQ